MFFIGYLKQKNISRRGRQIALLIVGSVFLILAVWSVWQQYYADTLVKYVPEDIMFYVHFNLPRAGLSGSLDNLMRDVLPDGLELKYVKREVALVGQIEDNYLVPKVIFRTDRPRKVKKLLDSSGAPYDFLDSNRILITHDRVFNNFAQSILRGNGGLYLNARLTDNGLKFGKGSINRPLLPEKLGDFDIVLMSNNIVQLMSGWENKLENFSTDDLKEWQRQRSLLTGQYIDSGLKDKLIEREIILAFKKNQTTGSFDFVFSADLSKEELVDGELIQMESLLKWLVARQSPRERNIYLSDGMRVVDLQIDIDQFKFLERDGIMVLTKDGDDVGLRYQLDDRLVVASSKELLERASIELNGDYLKINTQLLPQGGLWDYVRHFSWLEVGGNVVILR